MFKIAHSADIHCTMKNSKQNEVERTAIAFAEGVEQQQPDLIVMAGDTFDEHDGKIRLDSRPARFCIGLVQRLAKVAPVVIVRGTPSHDRDTPYILRHIETVYPVYVGTEIEIIGLYQYSYDNPDGPKWFAPLSLGKDKLLAAITLFPSPDKAHVVTAFGGDSITTSNLNAGEALHDSMIAIGGFNASLADRNIPRILVAHGMITGSEYSSGTVAIGEDLEFTVTDLNLTETDYKAFGHVHKPQSFPGNIYYSGSLGRLNFGEQEAKSWNLATFEGNKLVQVEQIPSPARTFALFDFTVDAENDHPLTRLRLDLNSFADEKAGGADVRIRITVAEEDRHVIDREAIVKQMQDAGANEVKVEISIIPKVRQRAAGISKLETLSEKVARWGETVGEKIPERVLDIARTIEGREEGELIDDAERAVQVA